MNGLTSQTLKFWSLTATFVTLVAGFSLNQIPEAIAQAQTQAQSSEVQKLLKTKQCPGCNLSGANLQNADLDEANLQGANLQNANLQNADLEEANLQGANLQGANLIRADLEKANLQSANLQQASLQRADIEGANQVGMFTVLVDRNEKRNNLKGLQVPDLKVKNLDEMKQLFE